MLPLARLPLPLALLLATAGCISTGQRTLGAAAAPAFDAAAFFAGTTHGDGRLKIATRRTETVLVEGRGRIAPDGTIILDQSVRQGGRPARQRQWRLVQDRPGHLSGSLSDAAGPVTGEVSGNLLHLAFAMPGGMRAEQWLTLQAGGQIARNVMIVRKFGLPVARLDETIRRVEGGAPEKDGQANR